MPVVAASRWTLLALGSLLGGGCFEDPVPINPFDSSPGSSGDSTSSTGLAPDPDTRGPRPDPDSTTSGGSSSASSGPGSTGDSTRGPDVTTSGVWSSSGTTDPSGGSGSSSTTTGPSPHVPCPVGVLDGAVLPSTFVGNTALQDDELAGSCGGGSAPELALTFTAPADGTYTFDTGGSAIDTVLYILDGFCAGPELRCDDDSLANSTASLTSLPLAAGQTVTVVVDSFSIVGGPVTVTAREGNVLCPAQALTGSLPQTRSDQTLIASDAFEPSCGTEDEADQALAFVAPEDGVYRLDTQGSDFDTVLYVLDGMCTGDELACNHDEPGAAGDHSALVVPLTAGQAVTAVVEGHDGAAGNFDLSVDRLPGACPDQVLGAVPAPLMIMGSTAGQDEAAAGTCGGLGSPDYAYQWTAPLDAVYRFSTAGSTFDTVVYLLDGGCLGPELTCDDDTAGMTSEVVAYLLGGQTVVVVVDGMLDAGSFTLTVEETTDSGDCCLTHSTPGCEDTSVQLCVCALDPFCCTDEWDMTCVNQALMCEAICL